MHMCVHAHACCGTYVEARGQLMGAGSLPPPCGFERSVLQAWQQSPLPAWPSHQPPLQSKCYTSRAQGLSVQTTLCRLGSCQEAESLGQGSGSTSSAFKCLKTNGTPVRGDQNNLCFGKKPGRVVFFGSVPCFLLPLYVVVHVPN